MKTAKLNNNIIELITPYDPSVIGVIKRIPGRMFNPKTSMWSLPVDGLLPVNLERLRTVGFAIDPALEVLGRPLSPPSQSVPVLGALNASSEDGNMHLRAYQVEKATEAIARKGGLIRGFCGCGKTAISLAVLRALGCNRVLVVCPKSVLVNWQREARMWLGIDARVITGSPAQRAMSYELGTPFNIITYDTMRIDINHFALQEYDAVIFDEVHYLVSQVSGRSKAARLIRAKYKYGLTATPIMNSALDVYGVFRALNHDLGNYKLFVERYCEKDVWGSIKYFKNQDELRARIRPWIVPIDLSEAKFQLPARTDTDIEFELSPAEASLYDRIKKELLFDLQQSEVSKLSSPMILQNTLVKLGKLQELTDSCELIGESSESTKLDIVKEHLKDNLNENKAIIFTRFSRMAEILARELDGFGVCLLTGQVYDRQEIIDSFTSDKSKRIFISTEAGGLGINLQAANIIYNYDLPFSLGKLEQRLGRIRWHTQDRPVFFYNLMALLPKGKKSIDHWVKDKIIKKQEMSDNLLMSDIREILTQ